MRAVLALAAVLLLMPAPRASAEGSLYDRVKAARNEADAVRDAGSPLVARAAYVELAGELEGVDETELTWLRASIEARLGTLSHALGELDEADLWWNRSMEDYLLSDRYVSSARILANLAVLESDRGRSDLALDWLTEAMDMHEAGARPDLVAFDLYLRAGVHRELGEFGPALRDLVEAVQLFEDHGDIAPGGRHREQYLNCRGFIAEFALQLGEARVAAEELARILEETDWTDAATVAKWRIVEAAAWSNASDHERATRSLGLAREAAALAGFPDDYPTLLRAGAHIAERAGALDEACSLAAAAWRTAEQSGQTFDQLWAGSSWARCLNARSEHELALLVAREAQEVGDRAGALSAWETWYQEARALAALGEVDAAGAAFGEAAALLSLSLDEMRLDAVAMGRWRLDMDHVFDDAARARLAAARDPEDIEAALDLLEQNRSRLLLSAVLGVKAANPTSALGPVEDEAASLPGPTRRSVGVVRRLPAVQRRPWIARLGLRGDEAGPPSKVDDRRARALGASIVPVMLLRSRLPRSTGIAVFHTSKGGTDLFWLQRERVEVHRLAAGEDQLRGLVDRYVLAMNRSVSDPGGMPEFELASKALRSAVLGPVEERLRGVRQLVVIPDGDLYRVPFAALRGERRYLVEQVAVSISPSLNIFDALLDREPDRVTSFVGLADPRADLPRARQEVAEAAGLFDDRRTLVGEAAGLEALLEGLADADVLHLATHGELESSGRPSWLALAGDEVLDAEAILDLDLDLPLVTLSACRSARGGQAAGESLVNSLARSFLAAGAESVVGSLWDVHDGSTSELMSRFYESLAAGGFVADSLADAQRGMALSGSTYAHPWYWAGFVVVGDPR